MARTIYGKVDFEDGMKIKFGGADPCSDRIDCIAEDLEGCIHLTGEHANQVEVVISEAELEECNDTYYGCIDFSTGKFQISIPDTCCSGITAECEYCDTTQPSALDITFTGIASVGCCNYPINSGNDDNMSAVFNNQTFRLTHVSGCVYQYKDTNFF